MENLQPASFGVIVELRIAIHQRFMLRCKQIKKT